MGSPFPRAHGWVTRHQPHRGPVHPGVEAPTPPVDRCHPTWSYRNDAWWAHVAAALTAAVGVGAALGSRSWDVAIDTWSGAPRAVRDAAAMLVDRVGHYGYVSSRSVYRWPCPVGADESAPVIDGDPASCDRSDYAAGKRGGELAVLEAFGGQALVARAD
jgi:hypothetical protein